GMHCASCEVLIERKLKKVPGVEGVSAQYANGEAELLCTREPQLQELQQAIQKDGYTISHQQNRNPQQTLPYKNSKKDYVQIGAIFLIVVASYLILKELNLIPKLGITNNMGYGFVFLIGLVAALSTCLAVTGGLLLAVAAKYNERFPSLTGIQKIKPHLYFNIGRIISYTVFGGAIGAFGSILTLSPKAAGALTIMVSVVMVILGFQLLHLFPGLRRFQPKMPKFLAHKIHDFSGTDKKSAPFLLGAATFFLPCGFTQALQLYVLSKGDMLTGSLTMLAFSLGTLPALLSLSAISSFAKGLFQNYFLKFAGVTVIMLGLFNIGNGLSLTGSTFNLGSILRASDKNMLKGQENGDVPIVNGKQIVNMRVVGLNYYPYQFTVAQGVPIEWRIDGSKAEGCAQVITVPKLDIVQYLSPTDLTVIEFMPDEIGSIEFSCTMGMTTRGAAFTVIPNTLGIDAIKNTDAPKTVSPCNPQIANCIEAQQIKIEVSGERGVYPDTVTVKKGIPVDLAIDAKTPLGGCMSVWVIPEYNVTIPMKVGINKASFTPTKTGPLALTCSMGSRMAQINVIN
ncbi:sulfite exporter TauE/SafE family protein, partial [Candidatus Uhrbacteria bacterium]|nr:sulfite exporter TauE/SafE family protein [Candidatus Uhrbacteria bacterium]